MTAGRNDPDPPENLNVLDTLKELRQALLRDLLEKVKEGQATPQELAIIRAILKDNGLVLVAPDPGGEDEDLGERPPLDLPVYDQPTYE